MECYEVAK